METKIKLQAHRGVSTDYPENTMSAFIASVELGYDSIELDPNVTSDGKIVLLHDDTVNRTSRNKDGTKLENEIRVSDFSYEELAEYDFGIWFSEKFMGEKLPLLLDVLELAAKTGILIKIDSKFTKFDNKIQDELFKMTEESGANIAFTCNSPEVIELVRRNAPSAAIHYDGAVNEETVQRVVSASEGSKLVIWLPYRCELTSWVQIPFADDELCSMVKKYAQLGLWLLSTEKQLDEAKRWKVDYVETTGAIKPQ